jgi:predicted ATP-grasp superfamily ATP-dependent carboligase
MRILAYEHFTALGARAPRALRVEGGAILAALAADLAGAGHLVTTFVGPGAAPAWAAALEETGARIERRDEIDPLPALLKGVEAAWVVAPETGGMLESLSRRVLAADRRLLGSTPPGVALAGSKLATCRTLAARGLRTVPTLALHTSCLPEAGRTWSFPMVVKPDDGVGSEGVSLVASEEELAAARNRALEISRSVVVQPYVEGRHASVSVLVGPAGAFPLAVQSQDMKVGPSFGYRGGEVPLETPDGGALELARAACAAIPGLAGFAGVDLVLAPDGPVVIEVNPRLTTAYVGLRRAAGVNVAALTLGVLDGSRARVTLERRVRFSVSGRVTILARGRRSAWSGDSRGTRQPRRQGRRGRQAAASRSEPRSAALE